MVECEGGSSRESTTGSVSATMVVGDTPSTMVGSLPSSVPSSGNPPVGSDGVIPIRSDSATGGDPDKYEVEEDGNSRRTSKVWKHYKRLKVKGLPKVECIYCNQKLGAHPRSGTTHLCDHVERCLKRTQRDPKQMWINFKKKNIENEKVGLSNVDASIVRAKIARMTVLHRFPIAIVDYVGFQEVCLELNPTFKCVSQNTIWSDIVKMFQKEKADVMRLLARSDSRVSITTDMWTSSNQQKGYMAITAHYIDENWSLQSLILRFAYVPSPHTAEALTQVLVECFFYWNVDTKILAVTVDNCTTNDAMVSNLLDRLDLSALLLRGRLIHMRCSAHIINLIVKYGPDIIAGAIEKDRDNVVFWTASPKRIQRFIEAANHENMRYEKMLVLDCKTCWNSTYLMLTSVIHYKKDFSRAKQREPLYKTLPSEEEWELADEICEKLSYFFDMTKLFSGSKYPTVHLFFNDMCEIRMQLGEWIDDFNPMISAMEEKMLNKFNSHWLVTHGIMAVGVFLDPRYKLTTLDHFYNELKPCAESTLEYCKIKNYISEMMYQHMQELDERMPKRTNTETVPSSSNDASSLQPNNKKQKLFVPSVMKAKALNTQTCHVTLDSVRSEFKNYVEMECLPDKPLDILGWWRTGGGSFPILQAMGRDILDVSLSTVASESSFSTSGNVLSKNRSKLKPEFLEALICGQSWLWNQIRGESPATEKIKLPLSIENDEEDVECDDASTVIE